MKNPRKVFRYDSCFDTLAVTVVNDRACGWIALDPHTTPDDMPCVIAFTACCPVGCVRQLLKKTSGCCIKRNGQTGACVCLSIFWRVRYYRIVFVRGGWEKVACSNSRKIATTIVCSTSFVLFVLFVLSCFLKIFRLWERCRGSVLSDKYFTYWWVVVEKKKCTSTCITNPWQYY